MTTQRLPVQTLQQLTQNSKTTQRASIMKHLFTACAFLASCATSQATLLNFEDATMFGGDDAAVTDAYLQSYGLSINAFAGKNANKATEVTLSFESAGDDATNAFGFTPNGRDLSSLGNYFLKLGPGSFPGNGLRYFIMSLDFNEDVDMASGEICDIDGPEQFEVIGFDANGDEVASVESPVGGLDGLAWNWELAVTGVTAISSVKINKLGNGQIGGIAFDNFSFGSSSSVTANVPIPAAFPLGCLGLIAVFVRRRQRGKQ